MRASAVFVTQEAVATPEEALAAVKFTGSYEFGIHTVEDWNGNGGGTSNLGQRVFSIGSGKVIYWNSIPRSNSARPS